MSEDEPEIICPTCSGAMKLVMTTPKLGGLPELLTFECVRCGDIRTLEKEE